MISDEEKKAMEEMGLKIEAFYDFPNPQSIDFNDKDVKYLETILNLIEKQSKELEVITLSFKELEVITLSFKEIQERDKKWQEKIKSKIEQIYIEYEKILSDEKRNLNEKNIATFQYEAMRTVLEKLLEEE